MMKLTTIRTATGKEDPCVVPTVNLGGVMVWGALLVSLSVIYLEFKAQLTSMATTAFCSDTPSHLVCS